MAIASLSRSPCLGSIDRDDLAGYIGRRSETRNETRPATSSTVPARFIGTSRSMASAPNVSSDAGGDNAGRHAAFTVM